MRDPLGGGVGAVSRAEGVVHVEVAQRREGLGELGIVRFLTGPEPGVLDESDAAPRAPPGRRGPRPGLRDELDRRTEQSLEGSRSLLQWHPGLAACRAA